MNISFYIPRKRGKYLQDKGFLHPISLNKGSATVNVDSETVTDDELVKLKMTRESFNEAIPRDYPREIDALENRLKTLEGVR